MSDRASEPKPREKAAIEAVINTFAEYGIEFRAPWQCDLDDLEAERFQALTAALDTYAIAMRRVPV